MTSEVSSRPTVTVALFAYNQERFIADAVKSVLEQTYSPLQIFLSDDCSTDHTFEVMERLVADYDGPHEVVLIQSQQNRGLVGQINNAVKQARGSIIVLAAGDDVSLPDRVEKLIAEFEKSDRIKAVLSGHVEINPAGDRIRSVDLPEDFEPFTRLRSVAKLGGCIGLGAALAYHRDCFESASPIPDQILCEDGFLTFRAAMLGSIGFVREPLIKYRVHDSSATAQARFMTAEYQSTARAILRRELDAAYQSGRIDRATLEEGRRGLDSNSLYMRRSSRLVGRPLLSRAYYAWYFRDLWPARLRLRLGR